MLKLEKLCSSPILSHCQRELTLPLSYIMLKKTSYDTNLYETDSQQNVMLTIEQDIRVSCLAQTTWATLCKGVQLISGCPYTKTEQLYRLTSSGGFTYRLSYKYRVICIAYVCFSITKPYHRSSTFKR